MEIINYAQEIGATTYPGRGILLGKSRSGKYAAIRESLLYLFRGVL